MTRRTARGHAVLALGALALLGGAGVGCRDADASGTRTVRFWGLGREGEVVASLVPEFERRNPGIRVQVQQMPWTAAHEKMLTAFVGAATPDVAQLGNTWVPEFAALGALAPLDARIARSSSVKAAGFFPGIWATNVVNDTAFGIPWYVDTRAMFYRPDLLRRAGVGRPPETWEEWRDAMRRVKALGGATEFGALLPLDEWALPVLLGLQAGSPLLTPGGRRGAFRDPRFREAFAFYVSLFEEGLAPAVANTQISNVYQEFARGRFAFYVTGPWNVGEFRRRLPADMQDAWAVAPLPGPRGAERGASLAGGSSLVLFERSTEQDAAWRFIEYLAEPEQQLRFLELTGDLPARVEPWSDPKLAGDAALRAFGIQLSRAKPTPAVPEIELLVQRVAQYAEQAARKRMTVDEALAALDREVDGILEKRRWVLDRAATAARERAPVPAGGGT